ncbi:mitochondrial inner membrane protein required for protein import [Tilletia horrida]|nr:mitochondrial inner membrane protein required for protein import [Tilletia horrida]
MMQISRVAARGAQGLLSLSAGSASAIASSSSKGVPAAASVAARLAAASRRDASAVLSLRRAMTPRAYATVQPPKPPTEGDESGTKAEEQTPAEESDVPLRRPSAFNLDTTSAPLLLGRGKGADGKGGADDGSSEGGDGQKRPTAEQTGRGVLRIVWLAITGLAGYAIYVGGQPLSEQEKLEYKDNPLAESWFGRIRLRVFSVQSELSSPVSDVLLPPQDPRIARPYTLVIELDDLLVHSDWDRQRGWRIAKRPGLDYFLGYLSTFFEIIVFTSSPQFGSEPILQKLDQDGRYIFQRLYKEHCRFVDGELVKDLSYLNRDLNKTIILDTDRSRFRLQPENGLVVKPWSGDPSDRELFGWIQLLESIFIWNFPDVRQFIKSYEGVEDVPAAHKARLDAHRQSELGQLEAAAKQRKRFGFGGTSITGQGTRAREPKTYYDAQSELFHKMYIEDEANWQQNKENWRKQNEELDAKRWEKFVAEHGQPSTWDMIQVQMGMKPPFDLPDVTPEELEASKKATTAAEAEKAAGSAAAK